jgi:ZIP family zinc transporter
VPIWAAITPFFSTMTGGIIALRLRHRLHPFMALAAGLLVATALVDLLPEAIGQLGPGGGVHAGIAAVAGFLLFAIIEAFVHRGSLEHRDEPDSSGTGVIVPLALLTPLGLIVHSLLDGVAIGAGFAVGSQVGLVVLLAVAAHDVSDGANVAMLSLRGTTNVRAVWVLVVGDALAPVIGAIIGYSFGPSGSSLGLLLGAFAGAFIAIGAGHLLPEVSHDRPGQINLTMALVAAGAIGAIVIRLAAG